MQEIIFELNKMLFSEQPGLSHFETHTMLSIKVDFKNCMRYAREK